MDVKITKTLTQERLDLIQRILKAGSLTKEAYTSQEVVDNAKEYILKHQNELELLPAYVVGDLTGLETDTFRRTLMAFYRRICKFIHGNLGSTRKQYTIRGKKNRTAYFYKLVM